MGCTPGSFAPHTRGKNDPFLVINAGHICCWAAGDALLVTRSPCTRCTGNGVGVRGVPALVEISTGSLPAPSLAVRDARMLFGLLSLPASCLNDARRARAALGHAWACAASPRWPAARRAPTPAAALRRPSSPRCGRDAPTVVVHYYARRRRRAKKKENVTRPRKKCAAALFSGWSVGNPLSLPFARHARTPMAGRPRPRRRPCLPALLCLLSAMGRAASGSRMFTCHATPTYTYTQPSRVARSNV